ncbi:hypothetical protein AMTRI_Chr11g153430 [Amborella trichopoda]
MAPEKDNVISKGKGNIIEQADNGREKKVLLLFSRGLRSSEIPQCANGFPVIGSWFKDWFLSARWWPKLMVFLASVSMITILNMASFHVNFPFHEDLAERFNYQTNTFFLPTGETTPTLEAVVRVSGLSLVGIAYLPSIAIDNHSIMGARLLGAAYSSHDHYTIVQTVLAGIYRGLHDRNLLKKARTELGRFELGDTSGVARIWAYEHIAIVLPPRSTTAVSEALGLVYVNDTTRPRDINYYRRVLDKLSSFDWVIRGLENVPLFLPVMGHSCLILVGQHFTEGYFPQRVLRQFRHTQNYTSSKGKKSSSSEGLVKQDKPMTTSNYDSLWERACPLSLCPISLRLHDEPSTPAQGYMPSREDDASSSNKQVKSNEDVSDISLENAETEWARWAAFVTELKEKDVNPNSKTE